MTPDGRVYPLSVGRLFDQLEPVPVRLGADVNDFFVDEIPAYELSGEGEHLFVRIEKRGLNTADAVRVIAEAAGVVPGHIGYAGLKDRHAVTRQWLSLSALEAKPCDSWQLPPSIVVLESGIHSNKLRIGHLKGNRFRLRLVSEDSDPVREDALAAALLPRLLTHGFANVFDSQRFGHEGRNLDLALDWIRRGASKRRIRDRRKRAFLVSVVQSEIFNRYLEHRRQLGLEKLIEGEWVRLDGAGAGFAVADLAAEQERFERGDLHLTGPLPGPKMRQASGAALQLESEVCAELQLDDAALQGMGAFGAGTRRDLLARPDAAQWQRGADGRAEFSFVLPAGVYATRLLLELTGAGADIARGRGLGQVSE